MSVTAGPSGRLDIGAVVTDTFAVVQRNLRTFGLAALILVVLPNLLQIGVSLLFPTKLAAQAAGFAAGGAGAIPPFPQISAAAIVVAIVGAICGLTMNGGLFYAAAKDLDGEPVEVKDLILTGLKSSLPLLGLYILMAISVELGLILLLVPGIYLFIRWSAAGPAVAVEGRGVFAAMKRSADLTKGRRWTLLLLWLVIVLILAAIDLGLVAAMGGFAGVAARAYQPSLTPMTLLLLIPSVLIGIAFSIGLGVLGGVIFHHLRGREGMTRAAVAEVFG
jgi:hypothetical protein